MATSGTQAFTLDLAEIIEEAFERAGSEVRTGYDYRTARRSLDLLLLEWQNKGLNLWTVKTATEPLLANQTAYPLTAEKLDIVEALLRQDAGDQTKQTDLTMDRMSLSAYAHQTNKLTTGRPTRFWLERARGAITVNVWPAPDASNTYSLFYYYMERIEDTGKPGNNTIDVPDRYLPCLIAGLAYYLGMKVPGAAPALPMLKQVYDGQWDLAADASRDKASLFVRPGGYT